MQDDLITKWVRLQFPLLICRTKRVTTKNMNVTVGTDEAEAGVEAGCRHLKDMFLCELLQAAHCGLLELHQTLTGTWVLHFDLPLALLCSHRQHKHVSVYIHKMLRGSGKFTPLHIKQKPYED